jgi:hypothetical protein
VSERDFAEFIRILNRHRVRFLIVGASAADSCRRAPLSSFRAARRNLTFRQYALNQYR